MIMSRNTAAEQQVMELRDQLQAREKSLAAKEFEQQAMMQERQRLQEQKEKNHWPRAKAVSRESCSSTTMRITAK